MLKFFVGLEPPHSQVTDDELKCLVSYSSQAKVVVELGCYEGKTTAALAKNCSGEVFAVDPFFKGRLGLCYGEMIARKHCQRNGLRNVRFISDFSYKAAANFDIKIDFLFIDADHSYEAIRRDWDDWFPKVKNGGFIALHDSRIAPNSPEYLGSMKFYDEDLPRVTEVKEVGTVGSLAVLSVSR
jgi:predicted O-methyltransferase YrrM